MKIEVLTEMPAIPTNDKQKVSYAKKFLEMQGYFEHEFSINADGSIDFHQDLELIDINRTYRVIPKFNSVAGAIYIHAGIEPTLLKNFDWCPAKIEGRFSISGIDTLKSLHGVPEAPSYSFNNIQNLKDFTGMPQTFSGEPPNVRVYNCGFDSLNGLPERVGRLCLGSCDNLRDLTDIPKYIKKIELHSLRNLESVKGIGRVKGVKNIILTALPRLTQGIMGVLSHNWESRKDPNVLNIESCSKTAQECHKIAKKHEDLLDAQEEIFDTIGLEAGEI